MKESNWQMLQPAELINADNLPERFKEKEVWRNDTYTVFVRRMQLFNGVPCAMTWLSIKRNDKEPCRDWRHFQWIKNQLCGPECEAVEIFPAESRLVDGSNQYHLWVLDDDKCNFPFGFFEGRTVTRNPLPGGKQRPFPDNMLPADIEQCEKRVDQALQEQINEKQNGNENK